MLVAQQEYRIKECHRVTAHPFCYLDNLCDGVVVPAPGTTGDIAEDDHWVGGVCQDLHRSLGLELPVQVISTMAADGKFNLNGGQVITVMEISLEVLSRTSNQLC